MPKPSRLILAPIDKKNSYDAKEHILQHTKEIILPISIGQPYHEGAKLEETLNLIKKTFPQSILPTIRIVLADTLQRYSVAFQEGKIPEACEVITRENGQEWKKRYFLPIKSLLGNFKLETWDVWRNHILFEQSKNQIEDYYQKNKPFREAIEADINDFEQRRRQSSHPNGFNETEKAYCRAYIKEECAVLKIWEYDHVSPSYRIIIYPKKIPQAMTLIKSHWTQFKSFSAELHVSSSEKKCSFFSGIKPSKHEENAATIFLKHSFKK